jgi:hypothetical protein
MSVVHIHMYVHLLEQKLTLIRIAEDVNAHMIMKNVQRIKENIVDKDSL